MTGHGVNQRRQLQFLRADLVVLHPPQHSTVTGGLAETRSQVLHCRGLAPPQSHYTYVPQM